MIGIFFTPVVGLLLGVTVRDDELHAVAIVGMLVVIAGAMLTSRPEPRRAPRAAAAELVTPAPPG
jgi:drug/metabolite transporter (DMT)-like permease